MTRAFVNDFKSTSLFPLLACCLVLIPLLVLPQKAFAATVASDNFNRANGGLGPNWTSQSDGGLAIASQAVAGTAAGAVSGDVWSAGTFTGNQYSQVTVTSTQLTGGQWIGPSVRAQNGGLSAYVGIYFWNNGSPELLLFKRSGSDAWTQLGSSYNSGPLAAGARLEVMAAGSKVSFLLNGITRISATNTSLSGGAPGIMSYGTGRVDNWSGGDNPLAYSVGGTVSGLSGTVVLQDNGQDNLLVSANGSFAFVRALAAGAAYAVTVKTNPAGQACSVSNGSGVMPSRNVTNVAVSCVGHQHVVPADDFSRPDGSLGPNWTDISDGGLRVTSHAAAGANSAGVSGDVWSAGTFRGNQYSRVTVTSTQLAGGQWIGPMVRSQNGGRAAYVGIYSWSNGSPVLMLFERSGHGATWTQLGSTYDSGPLSAGAQLEVVAVGSTISFVLNGVTRISATSTGLSGGAPGIMSYGTGRVDNWSGGSINAGAGMQATRLRTDATGITSYQVFSRDNGYGPQMLRVLRPAHPAPGVPHNFLYVLPVEPGLNSNFGDGLELLRSLDAQNQYNLTIIEPTFGTDPWYANNPIDPNVQYESFMTKDLVPWVTKKLATTGREQNWLIGFSKSGIGGQDLILKHPGIFALAASWDFPADMSSYSEFGSDSEAGYGTDANFQANYRLKASFVNAHKAPFLNHKRIWIGGYSLYQTDVSDYNNLLTSKGILHSSEKPRDVAHRWDSGWVPIALAALHQDSSSLRGR